jgi:hypothetical protein
MDAFTPNRSRVRVVDTRDIAVAYRETFHQKKVRSEREFPFTWPAQMQRIGDSLAIAYDSDKWKEDGDYELYKHIAESRNRVYCKKGFLHAFRDPKRAWPVIGPMKSFAGIPMPKHFALLDYFEEAHFVLFTDKDARGRPCFSKDKDEGVIKVQCRHALIGASMIKWSLVDRRAPDQPILFVYTEPGRGDPGGVHFILAGDELDVKKDGIVG